MTKRDFEKICDHIFPIRKEFFAPYPAFADKQFDYPNYAGLPKKISNKLSPEAVDALQDTLNGNLPFSKSKKEFKNTYKKRLKELGEPLRF